MATKVKIPSDMNKLKENVCAALEKMNITAKVSSARGAGGTIGVILSAEIITDSGTEQAVIKTTPLDIDLRKNIPITPMFKREMLFYTKILPEYEKIQSEMTKKCHIAKCYGVNDEFSKEFLVLEDLRHKDFVRYEPETPINFEHAVITMRVLAKLHGMAMVFEKRNPVKFVEITKSLQEYNNVFFDSAFDYDSLGARTYGVEAFKKFMSCVKDEKKKMKLIEAAGGTDEFVKTLRKLWGHGKRRIIIHGDYWTDNLLFKYKNNIPIDAAVLDFANVCYASIGNDILDYFSAAFKHEPGFRTDFFQPLLDQYYTSLTEVLADCGYNIKEIFSRKELQDEISSQWFVGFSIAILWLPLHTAEEDINLQEWWSGELPPEFYRVTDDYQHCIDELISDYTKLGFL